MLFWLKLLDLSNVEFNRNSYFVVLLFVFFRCLIIDKYQMISNAALFHSFSILRLRQYFFVINQLTWKSAFLKVFVLFLIW